MASDGPYATLTLLTRGTPVEKQPFGPSVPMHDVYLGFLRQLLPGPRSWDGSGCLPGSRASGSWFKKATFCLSSSLLRINPSKHSMRTTKMVGRMVLGRDRTRRACVLTTAAFTNIVVDYCRRPLTGDGTECGGQLRDSEG